MKKYEVEIKYEGKEPYTIIVETRDLASYMHSYFRNRQITNWEILSEISTGKDNMLFG